MPTTAFFNLIIHEYGFSMRELTPIAINKIVGFELLYHSLGHQPTVPGFKHFFSMLPPSLGLEPFLVGEESLPSFMIKNPRRIGRRSFCG